MPTSDTLTRPHGFAAPSGVATAEPAEDAPRPATASLAGPRCWPSQELLGPGVEALIRHGDALYRLRLTRQGKLILTK